MIKNGREVCVVVNGDKVGHASREFFFDFFFSRTIFYKNVKLYEFSHSTHIYYIHD